MSNPAPMFVHGAKKSSIIIFESMVELGVPEDQTSELKIHGTDDNSLEH